MPLKRDMLKLQRTQIFEKLVRFETYLNSNTFDNDRKVTELSMRLAKIEMLFDEFESCQSHLDSNVQDDADNRGYFETLYFSAIAFAQSIIDKFKSQCQTSVQVVSTTSNPASQVNLPQLNLPRFKGDYNDYTSFRDTFQSLINKQENLDKIQKFHYLLSCLEGEALNLIHSLQLTETNYDIVLDLLK